MISVSVVTAKQWGAKPAKGLKRLSNPSFIIIHHTATRPGERPTLEQAKALARAIQSDHQNKRGWIDSGHNFLVSTG